MSTISYRIKPPEKNTKKPREFVNVRVRIEEFEISTGIQVSRKHWSQAKEKVKNVLGADYADEANIELSRLKTFLKREEVKLTTQGKNKSQQWLKDSISKYRNQPTSTQKEENIYFDSYFRKYIDNKKNGINKRTGKPFSRNTITDLEVMYNKVKSYQVFKGNNRLKLTDINLAFLRDFIEYMNIELLLTNLNNLNRYASTFKSVIKDARSRGLVVNNEIDHSDFFIPKQKTLDFALTKGEINKIFDLDLTQNESLDNVRDWFIIGVWTGLRISDLLRLGENSINDGLIYIENQKTEIPVMIPLHEQVEFILNKRKGKFPPKISDPTFNKNIKKICKKAGLTEIIEGNKTSPLIKNGKKFHRKVYDKYPKYELISSHICRRTFATIHYGEIDTLSIMKITGHSTEKQFIDYVKIPNSEYARRLKKYWDEQKRLKQLDKKQ
ncbi:Integrase [Tenacibaculum sp. 190130A14a]|uniref:tyrosine-type recombinase/integrase n=1 Tax=Tenacibaculum polynesiense TaxID=3137857 RepID=UPI0031FFF2F6